MRADRINIPGIATLLAMAAAWEASARTGLLTFEYLPAPSAIALAFIGIVRSGELAANTAKIKDLRDGSQRTVSFQELILTWHHNNQK